MGTLLSIDTESRVVNNTSARMKTLIVLLLVALPCITLAWGVRREKVEGAESCDVSDGDKQDCGVVGTTQEQCEGSGCCWRPVASSVKDTPWCYYPSGDGPGPGGDCGHLQQGLLPGVPYQQATQRTGGAWSSDRKVSWRLLRWRQSLATAYSSSCRVVLPGS